MILNYKECIEKYGSDYMIKKAISDGVLFQQEKGFYSDKPIVSELELIVAKYPRAIFTGASAYYYYGLTDVIPELYYLSTRRGDTRIKAANIKQTFINDDLFDVGKKQIQYQGIPIAIYSKERILVDLIRFKKKIPFDLYKEVISNYRRIIDEMDFFEMEDYASLLRQGKKIMDAVQLEVM